MSTLFTSLRQNSVRPGSGCVGLFPATAKSSFLLFCGRAAVLFLLAGAGLACAGSPPRLSETVSLPEPPAATRSNLAIIFTGSDATPWGLTMPPTALSVNSDGNLVLAAAGNLFDPGGRRFLMRTPAAVTDCAYTPEGALLVINGRSLGYYSGNAATPLLTLPRDGMRLAAGSGGIYVFGGGANALYLIAPARGYVKICEMPQSIAAAAVAGEVLFIAVANDIYRFEPGGELQFVCRVPGPAITSLTAAADGVVYFSAGRSLYAWRAGRVILMAADIGELVCWHANGLYVLDPGNRTLLRFTRLFADKPGTAHGKE